MFRSKRSSRDLAMRISRVRYVSRMKIVCMKLQAMDMHCVLCRVMSCHVTESIMCKSSMQRTFIEACRHNVCLWYPAAIQLLLNGISAQVLCQSSLGTYLRVSFDLIDYLLLDAYSAVWQLSKCQRQDRAQVADQSAKYLFDNLATQLFVHCHPTRSCLPRLSRQGSTNSVSASPLP